MGVWEDAEEDLFIKGNACWIDRTLLADGGKVNIGSISINHTGPLAFMWGGLNNSQFLIEYGGDWFEAEKADFIFIRPSAEG